MPQPPLILLNILTGSDNLSYSTLSALSRSELLAGGADVEFNLGLREVGAVEGVEIVGVGLPRVALGEEEGLGYIAVVVDGGEVGARDGAVLPLG